MRESQIADATDTATAMPALLMLSFAPPPSALVIVLHPDPKTATAVPHATPSVTRSGAMTVMWVVTPSAPQRVRNDASTRRTSRPVTAPAAAPALALAPRAPGGADVAACWRGVVPWVMGQKADYPGLPAS
jgi:hypothetical protein